MLAGKTYVDGELLTQKFKALPPPKEDHSFHVCCSERNPGAFALMQELAKARKMQLKLDDEDVDLVRRSSGLKELSFAPGFELSFSAGGLLELPFSAKRRSEKEVLHATKSVDRLSKCDHMLLYLTSQTWTRGEASEELAQEVGRAMDLGVHMLLAHESAHIRDSHDTRVPLQHPLFVPALTS
jgi:hypothetical protein